MTRGAHETSERSHANGERRLQSQRSRFWLALLPTLAQATTAIVVGELQHWRAASICAHTCARARSATLSLCVAVAACKAFFLFCVDSATTLAQRTSAATRWLRRRRRNEPLNICEASSPRKTRMNRRSSNRPAFWRSQQRRQRRQRRRRRRRRRVTRKIERRSIARQGRRRKSRAAARNKNAHISVETDGALSIRDGAPSPTNGKRRGQSIERRRAFALLIELLATATAATATTTTTTTMTTTTMMTTVTAAPSNEAHLATVIAFALANVCCLDFRRAMSRHSHIVDASRAQAQ